MFVYKVLFFSCTILAVCCVQIQAISLQRLNTNDAPVTADLSQLEQFLVSMSVENGRHHSKNGTTFAPPNALSNIISGLLSGFTAAITPSLGPFGPLVAIGAPVVNSALTGLITNALNDLGGYLHRKDHPDSGHESYTLNIPNKGSYILMANKLKPVPASIPQQPQFKNLFGNQQNQAQLFAGLENLLKSSGLMQSQQPTIEQSFQQKNNLILLPLDQMSDLNGMNALHGMFAQQQGRSISPEGDL